MIHLTLPMAPARAPMPITSAWPWSIFQSLLVGGCLLMAWPLAMADPQPMTRLPATKIANGLATTLWPAVVSLQYRSSPLHFCSGVLIGCRTVLSAAHCFCDTSPGDDGASCQADDDSGWSLRPDELTVFFQNAPPVAATAIQVQLTYEFAQRQDVALVTLAEPVDGLRTAPINLQGSPVLGTEGVLVGYGQSDQRVVDYGIKREGRVRLAACGPAGVPADEHLCWNFPGLAGADEPGAESNTCPGDSGGPLFVDGASEALVAGITSGGISPCQRSDTAFDADVFTNRGWIQANVASAGGEGLACGRLPPVGDAGTVIYTASGRLDTITTETRLSFTVTPETLVLRVALNGDDQLDLDLQVIGGDVDCRSQGPGVFEFCELSSPPSGTWEVVVRNSSAQSGDYQVVSTLFSLDPLFRDGFEGFPSSPEP